jgi:(E)-4-hydroxy-3-methylbut-2-enyl-diphosphate synthase
MVYVSGLADHRLKDADIVDHLVELVEKKAAAIEAAKREAAAAAFAPAQ